MRTETRTASGMMIDDNKDVLGLIAGNGDLPIELVEYCQKHCRPVFVLGFHGVTNMQRFENIPHTQVRLGAVGEALAALHKAGVRDIVLAGGFNRPSLLGLFPDAVATRLLPRLIGKLSNSGDNALLMEVITIIEEQGFNVVGCHEIAPGLLTPEGVLGQVQPDEHNLPDITKGIEAARALGAQDMGQAVIIANTEVIDREDRKGTNALIERSAVNKRAKGGVLVKVKKPGQTPKADLPAIGIATIEKAYKAGLNGIAIEAGASLIIGKGKTLEKADALGLFVIGVRT